MTVTLSLVQMVDVALGTPEVGAVNFNVLHTLLHAMLKRLEIGGEQAEVLVDDRELLKSLSPTTVLPTKPTVDPPVKETEPKSESADKSEKDVDESKIKDDEATRETEAVKKQSPETISLAEPRSSYHYLARKVAKLEEQIDALNRLPSTEDLYNQQQKSEAPSGKPVRPVVDMWQGMQLSKRVDSTEEGVSKLMQLVNDLMQDMTRLETENNSLRMQIEHLKNTQDEMRALQDEMRALQEKMPTNDKVKELEERVEKLEDAQLKVEGVLGSMPKEWSNFVTWKSLEDLLKGIRAEVDGQAAEIDEVRRNMIKQPTVMESVQVTPTETVAAGPSRPMSAESHGPSEMLKDMLEKLGMLHEKHEDLVVRVDNIEDELTMKASKDDLDGLGNMKGIPDDLRDQLLNFNKQLEFLMREREKLRSAVENAVPQMDLIERPAAPEPHSGVPSAMGMGPTPTSAYLTEPSRLSDQPPLELPPRVNTPLSEFSGGTITLQVEDKYRPKGEVIRQAKGFKLSRIERDIGREIKYMVPPQPQQRPTDDDDETAELLKEQVEADDANGELTQSYPEIEIDDVGPVTELGKRRASLRRQTLRRQSEGMATYYRRRQSEGMASYRNDFDRPLLPRPQAAYTRQIPQEQNDPAKPYERGPPHRPPLADRSPNVRRQVGVAAVARRGEPFVADDIQESIEEPTETVARVEPMPRVEATTTPRHSSAPPSRGSSRHQSDQAGVENNSPSREISATSSRRSRSASNRPDKQSSSTITLPSRGESRQSFRMVSRTEMYPEFNELAGIVHDETVRLANAEAAGAYKDRLVAYTTSNVYYNDGDEDELWPTAPTAPAFPAIPSATPIETVEVVKENECFPVPANDWDGEAFQKLHEAVNRLFDDIDRLNQTTDNLSDQNNNQQKNIEELLAEVAELRESKADKDYIDAELDQKADRKLVDSKVGRQLFDETISDIRDQLVDLLDKLTATDEAWRKAAHQLEGDLDGKLDRVELEIFKEYIDGRLKALNNKLNKMSMVDRSLDDAAGWKKQLVHCISCDRPVEMRPMSPPPSIPVQTPLPGIRTPRPFTTYELDSIRHQTKRTNAEAKHLSGYERAITQQWLSNMPVDDVRIVQQAIAYVSGTDRPIKPLAQSTRTAIREAVSVAVQTKAPFPETAAGQSVRTFCRARETTDIDIALNRRCGGQHTVTHPHHRISRLQHLGQVLSEEEAQLYAAYSEEHTVIGMDGQMYKGRLFDRSAADTKLPAVPQPTPPPKTPQKDTSMIPTLVPQQSTDEPIEEVTQLEEASRPMTRDGRGRSANQKEASPPVSRAGSVKSTDSTREKAKLSPHPPSATRSPDEFVQHQTTPRGSPASVAAVVIDNVEEEGMPHPSSAPAPVDARPRGETMVIRQLKSAPIVIKEEAVDENGVDPVVIPSGEIEVSDSPINPLVIESVEAENILLEEEPKPEESKAKEEDVIK